MGIALNSVSDDQQIDPEWIKAILSGAVQSPPSPADQADQADQQGQQQQSSGSPDWATNPRLDQLRPLNPAHPRVTPADVAAGRFTPVSSLAGSLPRPSDNGSATADAPDPSTPSWASGRPQGAGTTLPMVNPAAI